MVQSNQEYIRKAVIKAQKMAVSESIAIGKTIAHPDDPLAYGLKEIKGNIAVGFIPAECSPTGKEITKRFPLNEIFDVNLVNQIAQEMKARDTFNGLDGLLTVSLN